MSSPAANVVLVQRKKDEEATASSPSSPMSPPTSKREGTMASSSAPASSSSSRSTKRARCRIDRRGASARSSSAVALNNVAVSLLDHVLLHRRRDHGEGEVGGEGQHQEHEEGEEEEQDPRSFDVCVEMAIDVLRDSIDVLSPAAQSSPDGTASSSMMILATEAALDALVSAEEEAAGETKRKARRKQRQQKEEGRGSSSSSFPPRDNLFFDGPFSCADPIRMRSSKYGDHHSSGSPPPNLRGLLAVISYNLGLAYQILGARLGRQAHVDKATRFYKKAESILLDVVDGMEAAENYYVSGGRRSGSTHRNLMPPGVDITYFVRAIVNNMGLILLEWGDPTSGREYFDGLSSICVDLPHQQEAQQEEDITGQSTGRWNNFVVNAIIARGAVSSPAA